MISSSFDESNFVLSRPSELNHEQCNPLSVAVCQNEDGLPLIVSCWKLTQEEVETFQRTGRIWLAVVGQTMPPVSLSANSPFQQPEKEPEPCDADG